MKKKKNKKVDQQVESAIVFEQEEVKAGHSAPGDRTFTPKFESFNPQKFEGGVEVGKYYEHDNLHFVVRRKDQI